MATFSRTILLLFVAHLVLVQLTATNGVKYKHKSVKYKHKNVVGVRVRGRVVCTPLGNEPGSGIGGVHIGVSCNASMAGLFQAEATTDSNGDFTAVMTNLDGLILGPSLGCNLGVLLPITSHTTCSALPTSGLLSAPITLTGSIVRDKIIGHVVDATIGPFSWQGIEPPPVTNVVPPVTSAVPSVTNALAPVTYATPPVTNAAPPVTNVAPPVTNAEPPVTNGVLYKDQYVVGVQVRGQVDCTPFGNKPGYGINGVYVGVGCNEDPEVIRAEAITDYNGNFIAVMTNLDNLVLGSELGCSLGVPLPITSQATCSILPTSGMLTATITLTGSIVQTQIGPLADATIDSFSWH